MTFIIRVRGGGSSSGYISSGFYGGKRGRSLSLSYSKFCPILGLMVGRVALLRLNRLVCIANFVLMS